MYVPVPVVRRVWRYTARQSFWKWTNCERCRARYTYEVVCTLTRKSRKQTERAKKTLVESTNAALAKKVEQAKRATQVAACPVCGWYGADMIRTLRRRYRFTGYLIAACVLLPFATVVYNMRSWVWLIVCIAVVDTIVAATEIRARRDPNEEASSRVASRDPKKVMTEAEFADWSRRQQSRPK